MFHHNFSRYFSYYTLSSQKLKIRSELSEWNREEIFFPKNVYFMMWFNKWRYKEIDKKKKIFVTKICFEGCLYVVGNVSTNRRGHLFYFRFMESYWLFTDFQVNLHISIWALSFWAPTRFPELIRPRYGPDGRYEFSSISNTHGVQLFLEIINT